MVVRHNNLRGAFVEICYQVHLGVHVEGGTHLICHTPGYLGIVWAQGKLAAFDITIGHVCYICIVPNPGFQSCHQLLDSLEFQTAMQWWLCMSVSQCASCCCYPSSFFGLHHHDWYCKNVVTYHAKEPALMFR